MDDQSRESPSEMTRMPLLGLLARVLVLAIGVWVLDRLLYFQGLTSSDEMNYADVGRQFAGGLGLTQRTFLPGFLRWYDGARYQQYFVHPPGTPLLLAAAFKVKGVSEATAILPAACSFVLSGAALTWLVAVASGRTGLAALAAVLFCMNGWSTWYAISAMSEMPHALLVVVCFLVVTLFRGFGGGVFAGALWGFSYVIRQSSILLLPPLALYVGLEDRRRGERLPQSRMAWAIGFGLAAVAVLVPDAIREMHAFGSLGNPFLRSTLLIDTPLGDAGWIFLYGHPAATADPWSYFLAEPQVLLRKYVELSGYTFRRILPYLLNPTWFCLPLGGLLGLWKGAFRSLKLASLLALGLVIVVSPLSFVSGQYYVFLLPLASALSADSILWGWARLRVGPLWRRIVAGVVVVHFATAPLADTLSFISGRHVRPGDMVLQAAHRESVRQFFLQNTYPDEMIVTPLAFLASWVSDRRTMLYAYGHPPSDAPMWAAIQSRIAIDAIVYSSLMPQPGDPLLPGFHLVWCQTIDGTEFRLYRRHGSPPPPDVCSRRPGP